MREALVRAALVVACPSCVRLVSRQCVRLCFVRSLEFVSTVGRRSLCYCQMTPVLTPMQVEVTTRTIGHNVQFETLHHALIRKLTQLCKRIHGSESLNDVSTTAPGRGPSRYRAGYTLDSTLGAPFGHARCGNAVELPAPFKPPFPRALSPYSHPYTPSAQLTTAGRG